MPTIPTGFHLPIGTFASAPFNLTTKLEFGKLSWKGTADPPTTRVLIQIAAGDSNTTWSFIGPDGSADTHYANASSDIWSGLDGRRYARIRVMLETENGSVTPTVEEISLEYRPFEAEKGFLEQYWWAFVAVLVGIIAVAVVAFWARRGRPERE